jgi:hypothetical protein
MLFMESVPDAYRTDKKLSDKGNIQAPTIVSPHNNTLIYSICHVSGTSFSHSLVSILYFILFYLIISLRFTRYGNRDDPSSSHSRSGCGCIGAVFPSSCRGAHHYQVQRDRGRDHILQGS